MSLFIGNLSRKVTASELEKVFGDYGRCKINFFGKYAFAEFDAERDAEEAIKNLMGMNLSGSNINIEWSKKSRKFDSSKSRPRRSSVSPKRREGRCYICQSKGHYQKDCRDKDTRRKYRSRSRSRSRSRDRRRSNSRNKHRRHSRSRSRSSHSRSHSYRKKRRDTRERRRSSTSSNYRPKMRSSSSRRDNRNERTSSKYDRNDRRGNGKKERNERERSNSRNLEKKENTNNNNNHNQENININSIVEKEEVRLSRNSSPGSDRSARSNRSPIENLNKISELPSNNNPNLSTLEQILDEDFITGQTQNEFKEKGNENNSNTNNTEASNPNERKEENNENMDESYYNKLKVEELKSELKKRNINFPKNARKNELIELLTKNKP